MGIRLHLIELLAKVVPQESSNYPGCCQDNKLLSTNWQGPTAEGNTYPTHWTWRTPAGAHIEVSSLCFSVFGTGKYSICFQKRNIKPKKLQTVYLQWYPAFKTKSHSTYSKLRMVVHTLIPGLKASLVYPVSSIYSSQSQSETLPQKQQPTKKDNATLYFLFQLLPPILPPSTVPTSCQKVLILSLSWVYQTLRMFSLILWDSLLLL